MSLPLILYAAIGAALWCFSWATNRAARETFDSWEEFSSMFGQIALWPITVCLELRDLHRMRQWRREQAKRELEADVDD